MSTYAVVENGVVKAMILWDGNDDNWQPQGQETAILLDTDQAVSIGDTYDGSTFTRINADAPQPVLTQDEIVMRNTAAKSQLLTSAALAIAPLQDAVDLDIATAAITALLKLWKQYRINVSKVDVSQASPVWPPTPAATA